MSGGTELYEVLRRIRPVHDLAARAVTESLHDSGLTMPIRAVLERLIEVGDQTVPDLARWLSVSRQGVQAVVDAAKELGHVETRPNPAHRRSHLFTVTDRGRRAFEALHAEELGRLDDLARDLAPADVVACVRVLDHLVEGLDSLTSEDAVEVSR